MFKSVLFLLASCGLAAMCCGCSSDASTEASVFDPTKAPSTVSTVELKQKLQQIASTGAGGSSTIGVKESIDQLVRPSNSKLADDLLKDLDVLSRSSQTVEIKTMATRMANRL